MVFFVNILFKFCPRLFLMFMKIFQRQHYRDVIMGAMVSQITSLAIVYSTVYSGEDHRKHQSSESLAFVRGIHRGPVNSPHQWPVTRKMFPFDDVIMKLGWKIFENVTIWPHLVTKSTKCLKSNALSHGPWDELLSHWPYLKQKL